MILAVAVLLFQFPVAGAAANILQPANAQAVTETHAALPAAASIPVTATGKDSASDDSTKTSLRTVGPSPAPSPNLAASSMASVYLPPPTAFRPPDEPPVTHRKTWILLSAVEHSSAGYDAWSTRYALSNGRVEADPLMRPFAGSAGLYGAIQAIPIGLDYVAHRFQRSSGWTHHIWWAPQAIASATFLFSGSYNVAHTN
jgi:hypothetical protein